MKCAKCQSECRASPCFKCRQKIDVECLKCHKFFKEETIRENGLCGICHRKRLKENKQQVEIDIYMMENEDDPFVKYARSNPVDPKVAKAYMFFEN